MIKTITIHSMECYSILGELENVVKNITWTLTVQEMIGGSNETMSAVGRLTEIPPANAISFTPFNQLTESQVITWIELNTDIDALAMRLIAKREAKLNEVVTIKMAPPF